MNYIKFNLCLCVLLSYVSVVSADRINRQDVVTRNNPVVTKQDSLSSLSVGNGHFAVTVDVTGLQSFPDIYKNGVPLCAMSDWGWHSFPNNKGLKEEDTQRTMDLGHGRKEIYAVEYKNEGVGKLATEYFRVNPHRLNLGNVGLRFYQFNKVLSLSDVKDIHQELNLYDGIINSRYAVGGHDFEVNTAVSPNSSAMLFDIKSKALKNNGADIYISLPYVTGQHADAASNWIDTLKHTSRIISQNKNSAIIEHTLDATTYYVYVSWIGNGKFFKVKAHEYALRPKSETISVKVEYSEKKVVLPITLNYVQAVNDVRTFWHSWWDKGAIVDFSKCKDERAKELERRTVLSQYLTYINCANDTPPQETGLTYNSWFGRPHLEMTWWHMVHFSLWNRREVMTRILDWYNNVAYPYAKKIAERQHFSGVRWMKMTDPWVGESPSNVGSFLTWQQPHYIYMAEEVYRNSPSLEVLEKYGQKVEETALFMADFASSCQKDSSSTIKLYGQTAMQESMSKDFSYNHPFEQVYWVYGLLTAQKWRERRGLPRHAEWDEIIKRIAVLPECNGIYTAGEPTQPFLNDDTQLTATFDPFNYGGESGKKQLSKTDFYNKCKSDHPAVLGACGLLPDYNMFDRAYMQRTLTWAMSSWNWDTTWGWDYGMTAMCAARLGDGETAVRALLMEKGKNTYLVSGHNYQEPKRLRLYLPGNGSLLTAIAMMCAGWDGCPKRKNPGFPDNGMWQVEWEGLVPMQ